MTEIKAKAAIKSIAEVIHQVAASAAYQEAKLLVLHVTDLRPEEFLLNPETILTPAQYQHLEELAHKRALGMPLSKVLGRREFWSLSFKVTPDTLDPRPDSETLIETICASRPDFTHAYKILDLGTGSGCLLLSLLHQYPNATGVGVDLSQPVLKVAAENAHDLGLEDRATWVHANWCEGLEGTYDIIISNPPYITEAEFQTLEKTVKDYDPYSALVSGPTGLEDYKKIISSVDKRLANDGIFAIEIGINQEQSVSKILTEYGFKTLEIRKDLAGIPRCILACK